MTTSRIEQAIEEIANCVTTDGSFGFEDAKLRQILSALVAEVEQAALESRANAIVVYIDPDSLTEVEVVRRRQRDGRSLWRVKRLSRVLMCDGTWEHEPLPSSRDDEWIARASWPTAAEAEAAYRRQPPTGAP